MMIASDDDDSVGRRRRRKGSDRGWGIEDGGRQTGQGHEALGSCWHGTMSLPRYVLPVGTLGTSMSGA